MTLQSGNVLVWPAGLNSLRSLGLLKGSTYVNVNGSCQWSYGREGNYLAISEIPISNRLGSEITSAV